MTTAKVPPELLQGVPRPVRTKGILSFPIALGIALVACCTILLPYNSYRQDRKDAALAARGVTITGTVDDLTQTRVRHGINYKISYEFTAPTAGQPSRFE